MVGSPINIALSGLAAASAKISTSAKNVAHSQTTAKYENGEIVTGAYKPETVVQTSLATGHVLIDIQQVDRDPVLIYDPDHPSANEEGFVEYPNVSLDEEVVNQIQAKNEYKANLAFLKRAEEIEDSLIDIIS